MPLVAHARADDEGNEGAGEGSKDANGYSDLEGGHLLCSDSIASAYSAFILASTANTALRSSSSNIPKEDALIPRAIIASDIVTGEFIARYSRIDAPKYETSLDFEGNAGPPTAMISSLIAISTP